MPFLPPNQQHQSTEGKNQQLEKYNAMEAKYHSVLAVHRKNWEPLVFLPALAIDKIPSHKHHKLNIANSIPCCTSSAYMI